MKYKELGKRRSIIQAKQEQLAERYSVHYAQTGLQKKINRAEEQCELLFKRLAERKIQVADFLDSFLTLRKLQHVRLIVVKKLKEMIRHGEKTRQRLREIHPEAQDFSVAFPQRIHHPCEPVCSLSTAVVLPPCCHRLFLPLGDHGNTARYLPLFPLCLDSDDESVCPGVYGRGPKRLTVPVRLQPLKVKQKRHRQAPP
ncbi:putative vacuolar protein sorting-associated protein 37D-like [Scophthalmus maximus]|uniref:Putative vacuolar protein sorting-associated protein 37D-like n=1 Tax=Scophthalmus maximus TaxID=52904 RepID=A0A2U9B4R3_SCOMX|nr:putative vacuolar protein sorting-associated protein 37D-like [Scophthalmus maximus]